MAVLGKENIIEVVRMQKAPYWRVMETVNSRQAGNYIATADFDNPELGIEDSLGKLRNVLNKLTPGRYLLTAFYKTDAKKSGVDTWIEVESGGHAKDATISGTGADFYLEGIGKVTADNFEQAIEQKFKKLKDEENEKLRIKNIEEENRRMKLEMREYDSSMNRGIMSIGAVVWNVMRTTEAGKEVIGMMGDFKKFNQDAKPKPNPQPADAPRSAYDEAVIVDDSISGAGGNAEAQMEAALETLAKDNPELISQLQLLAKLKSENPDLFNDAVDNLKTIAG